jgi:hypothetical protein
VVHVDHRGLCTLEDGVDLRAEPFGCQGLVCDVEASVSKERVNPDDLGLMTDDKAFEEFREGAADVLRVADNGDVLL